VLSLYGIGGEKVKVFRTTYLQTATSTELGQQADFANIQAETDERVEIFMVHLTHLLRQQTSMTSSHPTAKLSAPYIK